MTFCYFPDEDDEVIPPLGKYVFLWHAFGGSTLSADGTAVAPWATSPAGSYYGADDAEDQWGIRTVGATGICGPGGRRDITGRMLLLGGGLARYGSPLAVPHTPETQYATHWRMTSTDLTLPDGMFAPDVSIYGGGYALFGYVFTGDHHYEYAYAPIGPVYKWGFWWTFGLRQVVNGAPPGNFAMSAVYEPISDPTTAAAAAGPIWAPGLFWRFSSVDGVPPFTSATLLPDYGLTLIGGVDTPTYYGGAGDAGWMTLDAGLAVHMWYNGADYWFGPAQFYRYTDPAHPTPETLITAPIWAFFSDVVNQPRYAYGSYIAGSVLVQQVFAPMDLGAGSFPTPADADPRSSQIGERRQVWTGVYAFALDRQIYFVPGSSYYTFVTEDTYETDQDILVGTSMVNDPAYPWDIAPLPCLWWLHAGAAPVEDFYVPSGHHTGICSVDYNTVILDPTGENPPYGTPYQVTDVYMSTIEWAPGDDTATAHIHHRNGPADWTEVQAFTLDVSAGSGISPFFVSQEVRRDYDYNTATALSTITGDATELIVLTDGVLGGASTTTSFGPTNTHTGPIVALFLGLDTGTLVTKVIGNAAGKYLIAGRAVTIDPPPTV